MVILGHILRRWLANGGVKTANASTLPLARRDHVVGPHWQVGHQGIGNCVNLGKIPSNLARSWKIKIKPTAGDPVKDCNQAARRAPGLGSFRWVSQQRRTRKLLRFPISASSSSCTTRWHQSHGHTNTWSTELGQNCCFAKRGHVWLSLAPLLTLQHYTNRGGRTSASRQWHKNWNAKMAAEGNALAQTLKLIAFKGSWFQTNCCNCRCTVPKKKLGDPFQLESGSPSKKKHALKCKTLKNHIFTAKLFSWKMNIWCKLPIKSEIGNKDLCTQIFPRKTTNTLFEPMFKVLIFHYFLPQAQRSVVKALCFEMPISKSQAGPGTVNKRQVNTQMTP